MPGVLVSGSSEAGMAGARQLKATAVEYPQPPAEYATAPSANIASRGIRIGIIARSEDAEAWSVARSRYPEDRKGQLTHQLAMKVSDSSWHRQLSEMAEQTKTDRSPYRLRPFENYRTFCPYLAGSYDQVADELAPYIAIGYATSLLGIPPHPHEF